MIFNFFFSLKHSYLTFYVETTSVESGRGTICILGSALVSCLSVVVVVLEVLAYYVCKGLLVI